MASKNVILRMRESAEFTFTGFQYETYLTAFQRQYISSCKEVSV